MVARQSMGPRVGWQAGQREVTLANRRRAVLRPITTADADLIAEFFACMTPREIFYFFALDDAAARRLATEAAREQAWRLLAVSEEASGPRALGYMFLDWKKDDDTPVYGACLREDAQSSGLGRAMTDYLLTAAAAAGVGPVRLTVHADNWRALRLYQRAGFRVYDELMLQPQGSRQYRMRADLQTPRPPILAELVVVARGGLGVGLPAMQVQNTLEAALGQRPLLLDRPLHPEGRAIVIADLAAPADRAFETPAPPGLLAGDGPGWLVSLDERRLLIGGIGPAAVARAARAYCALLTGRTWSGSALDRLLTIPLAGLHESC